MNLEQEKTIEDLESQIEFLELEIDSLKQICFNRPLYDTNAGIISLEIIADPILEITNTKAHHNLVTLNKDLELV